MTSEFCQRDENIKWVLFDVTTITRNTMDFKIKEHGFATCYYRMEPLFCPIQNNGTPYLSFIIYKCIYEVDFDIDCLN